MPTCSTRFADETVATDAKSVRAYLEKVGHPALKLPDMADFAQSADGGRRSQIQRACRGPCRHGAPRDRGRSNGTVPGAGVGCAVLRSRRSGEDQGRGAAQQVTAEFKAGPDPADRPRDHCVTGREVPGRDSLADYPPSRPQPVAPPPVLRRRRQDRTAARSGSRPSRTSRSGRKRPRCRSISSRSAPPETQGGTRGKTLQIGGAHRHAVPRLGRADAQPPPGRHGSLRPHQPQVSRRCCARSTATLLDRAGGDGQGPGREVRGRPDQRPPGRHAPREGATARPSSRWSWSSRSWRRWMCR